MRGSKPEYPVEYTSFLKVLDFFFFFFSFAGVYTGRPVVVLNEAVIRRSPMVRTACSLDSFPLRSPAPTSPRQLSRDSLSLPSTGSALFYVCSSCFVLVYIRTCISHDIMAFHNVLRSIWEEEVIPDDHLDAAIVDLFRIM